MEGRETWLGQEWGQEVGVQTLAAGEEQAEGEFTDGGGTEAAGGGAAGGKGAVRVCGSPRRHSTASVLAAHRKCLSLTSQENSHEG